jgi:hypothetical protein
MEQSDRRETNNGLSSITGGKRPREDIPEKPKKRKRLPLGPDECVMCGIQNPTPFMSQMGCRMRRASRAHRICESCWFDKFVPSSDHRCPGCVKEMDFPPVRQTVVPADAEVVEL